MVPEIHPGRRLLEQTDKICLDLPVSNQLIHRRYVMAKEKETKIEASGMASESKKAPARDKVETERSQFRALTLANPNYFGNLQVSAFEPVKVMLSNKNYEEAKCVGFNPQTERLEAVVYIKRETGYGGDICSNGSVEFVRFYLSYNNGATWLDQGFVGFKVYDIPGPKPLEYDATLKIDPKKLFCFAENLPLVRAILSWNSIPPANTPGFTPVYGNVLDAHIQIEPRKFFVFKDLVEELEIKLPPQLIEAIDLEQPVPTAQPLQAEIAELVQQYQEKGIPPHRFLFSEIHPLIEKAGLDEMMLQPDFSGKLLGLDLSLSDILAKLLKTDGDTRFEELKCVGLNTRSNHLAGVLTVKLPNGYSGKLCSKGSTEYVAFWIDYGDGAGWTYAGTSSVVVHDIINMPANGLQYAVSLPVNFNCRRQPCEKGPRTARVRAILSWEVPPPPGNPNYVPTWGNREETLVHIMPGPECNLDDHTPYMDTVGNMAVCDINQTSGLASGAGVVAAFTANRSPFGGTVTITGFILNPPNVMAGALPFKYRVLVRELPTMGGPGPWQPLANSFNITITEQNGLGMPVQYNDTQSIGGDGFYTYREQAYPNQWREVAANVLAKWITATPMTGMWEIMLEAKLPDGTILPVGTILCLDDGSTRSSVKVWLDEVAPSADVTITGFSRGGGPVQPAVDCGTFQVGDIIYGKYASFDEHFNRLTLTVEPAGPAAGAIVNPSSRRFGFPDFVPTTGESGNWTLDTSGMQACGYVVRLWSIDRTIVNSGSIGWGRPDSVGFCLKDPNQNDGDC
jgi:hypothetical protein